jgi:hypothetical protein
MVTGAVDYCKVSQHNLQGVSFTADVTFNGKECQVQATASDE